MTYIFPLDMLPLLRHMFKVIVLSWQFQVSVMGDSYADMMQYMPEKEEPDYSRLILAPMPGLVKSVLVKPGDTVS